MSVAIVTADKSEDASSESTQNRPGWQLSVGDEAADSVVLAPSSDDCFFYSLPLPPTIDGRDRSAVQYELEHHLPMDAESMVVDYSVTKSDRQVVASALAIDWKPWQPIVEGIESSGRRVQAIVPQTILICRALSKKLRGGQTQTVVVDDQNALDWLRIDAQGVRGWDRISRDETSVKLHHATSQEDNENVTLVGRSAEVATWLSGQGYTLETHPKPADELASVGASMYEKQPESQWPNLRRDQLSPSDSLRAIRGPLRMAVMAGAMLLLCVAIGSWWRGNRIESEIALIRDGQDSAFKSTFPDSRVPAALLRRVRSEHTKMKGSRGASSAIELPISAPLVLGDLLAGIPKDVRFQIERIEIANGSLDIEMLMKNPVDAGKFADSLARSGFIVDPPITEQTDSAMFQCQITGTWDSAEREPTKGAPTKGEPENRESETENQSATSAEDRP